MFISYDYYRIFYYVAKYKSFTQAANILLSNQPNVTRTIKNLESMLGCQLFVRYNRGVKLTPEGKKLYAHIAVACEQIQIGEEELASDKSLESGIVSIGASETALLGFMLPVLNKFHNQYPGIRICISNYSTPQAVSALKDGIVDLAVVTTPNDIVRPLCEIPLKSFHEIIVCSSELFYLTEKVLHLKDLNEYPIICLRKETKTYEFYNDLFLKYGLTLDPDMEVATTDQIIPMVENNLGIGFVPEFIAKEALKNKKVFKLNLAEEIPKRFICLIKDAERSHNIAAKELEKMLLAEKAE
ncbi:MAG: LysR family transcriptional regulator [Clostridia bacterium]|jgi:DNA-binding transcriptional LysR family regulator|nr:LysR family transcriptional regulator [Clostridia bacterium]